MKDVAKMTDEQRAKLFPVILTQHNPQWKNWYNQESKLLLDNTQNISAIHHYGSTAIDNIMAKPTIDILIEVEKDADLDMLKDHIIALGYHYMKFGAEPSMMFVKGYTPNGFAERVFHIHVYYKGLQKDLLFRDYLNSHPKLAKEYESLKLNLKQKYEFDRDQYTFEKTEFIQRITHKALAEHKKKDAELTSL